MDYGHARSADISGFRYVIDKNILRPAGGTALDMLLTISEHSVNKPQTIQVPVSIRATEDYSYVGLDPKTHGPVLGPFPEYVLRWLLHVEREADYLFSPWSDSSMQRAVDKLLFLFGRFYIPDLHRYLGLLARTWTAIKYVERRFPHFNSSRTLGAKDFKAVQSSAVEMFAISNHLAVLSSYGLNSPLLEFGCFKGFSTAALSHICHETGLHMEVFDSFSGLPPSDSSVYQQGDFAGSIEEVRRNLKSFGRLDAVRFHKGYFADTVPGFKVPEVSCIWLDVDLELSAKDAMQTFPMLSPLGCVFSHECDPDWFVDGGVRQPPRGPDSVMPPILDAFKEDGRRLAGRFIHGQTGAFWDADDGIPVLPTDQLLRLKDAAIQGL